MLSPGLQREYNLQSKFISKLLCNARSPLEQTDGCYPVLLRYPRLGQTWVKASTCTDV